MTKPVLLVVDDEATTLRALEVALLRRFGADFRVLARESPQRALRVLERLRFAAEPVAVVIADQWMPTMTGVEFLSRAHVLHPSARRALLVDALDRSTNEPVSRGMALGWVDSWLLKPWEPVEQLYLRINEMLADWVEATSRPGWRAVRVVAEPWTLRAHEMQDLLDRNGIPADFHDPASAEGQRLLAQAGRDAARLPVMVFHDGEVLVDPSNPEVAEALGVHTRPPADRYDLIIVGAGPAGLSAAVYGASDGLSTLLLDSQAMGGQAGTSARIRNYLGFPRGVSGRQLAVSAAQQAQVLGAEYAFAHATGLERSGADRVIRLADGPVVAGRAVVVSVGATYRRLDAPGVEDLVGSGVFYGAAVSEASAVRGQPVFVVGAGNSAGQAATYLAKFADRVTLVVRGSSLSAAMSDYLIKELGATGNITVRRHTQVVRADGAGRLESLTLRDTETGSTETVPAAALFILIGARPHTEWLADALALDRHGFVLTGRDLPPQPPEADSLAQRPPLPLETSAPGVFAAGDVRHGSIKRVASAVGDGAVAVRLVHEYLAEPRRSST